MSRHYSVTEIAKYTGVSPQYIRYSIAKGRIKARKLGGIWISNREERDRLVRRKKILLDYRAKKMIKEIEEDSGEVQRTNYILPSV